jgi:ketosteroid isomerase-like protein
MTTAGDERIERLRRALDQFNATGELPDFGVAPGFELHQASSVVDTAGVFKGKTAFRDTLRELEEVFESLAFEAERILEAPGGEVVVLVLVRGRGRASGMEIDNRIAWVWTFRGEEAVRLVVFEEPERALEAVGLPA